MLPVKELLILDELGTLRISQLLPKFRMLKEVKEVETHGILEELGIVGLLPVLQILEVVDEC